LTALAGGIATVDPGEIEIALGSLSTENRLWSGCNYVVSNPGKRFRAAVLESAAAYGECPDPALVRRCAVAIELFRTATLAHDDVVDDDDLRRGRPTVAAHSGNLSTELGVGPGVVPAGGPPAGQGGGTELPRREPCEPPPSSLLPLVAPRRNVPRPRRPGRHSVPIPAAAA